MSLLTFSIASQKSSCQKCSHHRHINNNDTFSIHSPSLTSFLILHAASTTTMTQESSSKQQPQERILVLYGSHGGTAEAVAEKICALLPDKVVNNMDEQQPVVAIGPTALDDFLKEPAWTRLAIVVTSSFGVGHAPRNARNFRKLCDQWVEEYDGKECAPSSRPLTGLQFALLGLGSSTYSTYQQNPNAMCAGLTAAGATLIGQQGAADVAEGEDQQQDEIDAWIESLWEPLQQAMTGEQAPVSDKQLAKMNKQTVLSS